MKYCPYCGHRVNKAGLSEIIPGFKVKQFRCTHCKTKKGYYRRTTRPVDSKGNRLNVEEYKK